MVKSTKSQRLREKMRVAAKQSKQRTLDSLPETSKKELAEVVEFKQRKQIIINEISTVTKEDELVLKVSFKLLPSKNAFSRIASDLFFDGHKLNSMRFSILQGPLAAEDSEFTSVLEPSWSHVTPTLTPSPSIPELPSTLLVALLAGIVSSTLLLKMKPEGKSVIADQR